MMHVDDVLRGALETGRQRPDGTWQPAAPHPPPGFLPRLRDAWAVLRGRAHAVTYEERGKQ